MIRLHLYYHYHCAYCYHYFIITVIIMFIIIVVILLLFDPCHGSVRSDWFQVCHCRPCPIAPPKPDGANVVVQLIINNTK